MNNSITNWTVLFLSVVGSLWHENQISSIHEQIIQTTFSNWTNWFIEKLQEQFREFIFSEYISVCFSIQNYCKTRNMVHESYKPFMILLCCFCIFLMSESFNTHRCKCMEKSIENSLHTFPFSVLQKTDNRNHLERHQSEYDD